MESFICGNVNVRPTSNKNSIWVIMEFSRNHAGLQFWTFRDIHPIVASSPFKEWYHARFTTQPVSCKVELS